ncbi:MAG: glycerate kinase [Erysipelothrix sp.]|nr:glycerate kinase [Erysipelothrix sp.]
MKILIMCDSFKGSLTSSEVNRIIKESIQPYFIHHDIYTFAIADGGEGTLEAYVDATQAQLQSIPVNNPYFEPIGATYAYHDDVALVELAAAAGVNLIKNRLNPLETSTFGVGQLINHAIDAGHRHILLGLGGSATNDAGCGIASALGVRFYNKNNEVFIPTGKSLKDIAFIDYSQIRKQLLDVKFTVISDVKNPLYGPDGAAFVYAKQKGADDAMLEQLDEGLQHFAKMVRQTKQIDVQNITGAGAAGGSAAAMAAFFGAEIISGIDFFINLAGFKSHLSETELIITGEGRLDRQTLSGKVVYGISKLGQAKGIDVLAVVGQIGDKKIVAQLPLAEIIVIHQKSKPFAEIIKHAESDLRLAMQNWAYNKTVKID